MSRLAAVFLMAMASTALAQTNRTELKRGDLTGTDKEIIISVLEVPPGSSIDRMFTRARKRFMYWTARPCNFLTAERFRVRAEKQEFNIREVPHAGYKVVGDKPLKLLTVHIVDKGKPMTVPAK